MLALFLTSFALHAVTGAQEYSAEQTQHGEPAAGVMGYLGSSQLWFESVQNWQSEFMSVAVLTLLSIWLRQRSSPESKPVHKSHSETGERLRLRSGLVREGIVQYNAHRKADEPAVSSRYRIY